MTNKYLKDEYQKELLILGDGTQAMMEWEKPYMEACVQRLQPYGDVLEIGFGMGYSASEIQKFDVDSHTIIEPDPVVYERALEWASQYEKVQIVKGSWPYDFDRSKKYDCFFSDPCLFDWPEELYMFGNCTNIFLLMDSIQNLAKPKSRYSFYCVVGDGQEYGNRVGAWLETLNVDAIVDLQECIVSVPDNCEYVQNKKIYIPYVEVSTNTQNEE
tara:strand:+ start:20362 stop:21006 length:645 start_codon:yes stop_codon:yes gene_type:complete